MEARKDELRRAMDITMKPTAASDSRTVESMFRNIDEKLELILDAQDARFRMLDDKLDRFNRRMDTFERMSDSSPRQGPAPVVEDELARSAFETPREMRRRLGSLETSSSGLRRHSAAASSITDDGMSMHDTLRYIHERLTSLETQAQALPDKVTPAIHRRLDTLETQVKILPDRVDSLLRQLQSRLVDQASPLHNALVDPQRHHNNAALLARTEESLASMHRTLETLELQGRSLPDRVSMAVGGGKFGTYQSRAYSATDETLGYIHSRLESLEKQVGCLPDRLQRLADEDIVRQILTRLVPLESQLQVLPERMHHAIKDMASDMGAAVDQSLVALHGRFEAMEEQSLTRFDRLHLDHMEPLRIEMMEALPARHRDLLQENLSAVDSIVRGAVATILKQMDATTTTPVPPSADETATAVVAHLAPRFAPIEAHIQGLPEVIHLALEDNVSVVAMVVNDALAVMHRRLDSMEGLPESLKDAVHAATTAAAATAFAAAHATTTPTTTIAASTMTSPLKPTYTLPPTSPSVVRHASPPPNLAVPSPAAVVAVHDVKPLAFSPPPPPKPQPRPAPKAIKLVVRPNPTMPSTPPATRPAVPCTDAQAPTDAPRTRLRPLRKAAQVLQAAAPPSTPPTPSSKPVFAPRKRRATSCGGSGSTHSSTSTKTTTTYPKGEKARNNLEPEPSPTAAAATPHYHHRPAFKWSDGTTHAAPEDWVFPITTCRVLWELWYHGDMTTKIGPYRLLEKTDIKHHYVLKTRGKAAAVVQKIIDTAVDRGVVTSAAAIDALPHAACMAVFEQAFDVLMGQTKDDKLSILPLNACNNMFTTVYTMLVNHKRKRSDTDEG
ncbi:Aste57867_12156 [Aphanomyces stellatus]|uniref:Aste57867_12156 protein n=1 Tax=Aphanomyces stellatus TaxID=120398 RepID=A0A485KVF2_9STRA|nr:hypothetical protein As57867_012111 [Aphanomyces stellatus]VFT89010.1 Aste57867_12156 [Aphanomyces stellatus]